MLTLEEKLVLELALGLEMELELGTELMKDKNWP